MLKDILIARKVIIPARAFQWDGATAREGWPEWARKHAAISLIGKNGVAQIQVRHWKTGTQRIGRDGWIVLEGGEARGFSDKDFRAVYQEVVTINAKQPRTHTGRPQSSDQRFVHG